MKLIKYILIVFIISSSNLLALDESEFLNWKKRFKKIALENKISETTFDIVMSDVKFLPKVIEYDRYQPEFYEDTKTYISKRTSDKKVKIGKKLYIDNLSLINLYYLYSSSFFRSTTIVRYWSNISY